jgi:hypothetical protein
MFRDTLFEGVWPFNTLFLFGTHGFAMLLVGLLGRNRVAKALLGMMLSPMVSQSCRM